MIDDEGAAVASYTKHFGFTVDLNYAQTFVAISDYCSPVKKPAAGKQCLMGRNPFPVVGIAFSWWSPTSKPKRSDFALLA
jgi:hypothetical protein